MKKNHSILLVLILGIGLARGGVPFVSAQESSVDEFTLEEIVVTAEKREVNVQDTAMSITAVTGADIRDEALNTLAAAMKNIPSVEVAASITGGQIYIRGIGAYGGGEPATAVMLDEVYSGRSLTISGAMYDVDRVEVLRGPQGTLYGRNATGGIVNVVSRTPVIDEFEVLGNLQIGDYNLKHFDGAINIPLSDQVAGRVAVLREERDGYLSCGAADSNRFSARAKLLYKPNDKLSIMGTYDYSWERNHGNNTLPIPGSAGNLPRMGPPWAPVSALAWKVPDVDGDGVADDFGDPTQVAAPGPPGGPPPAAVDTSPDGIPDIIQTGWIVPTGADEWTNDQWHPAGTLYNIQKIYSLKIDWDLNWGLLTMVPSYSDAYHQNVDNMLLGIATSADGTLGSGQAGARTQYSGEARLTSPDESAFKWLIGYYGMKMEGGGGPNQQDPTTYDDSNWHWVNASSPGLTHAFFGQATYPVTERFRVTGGVRHSTDDNSQDYRYGNSQVDPSHALYAETGGTGVYDSGWLHFEQSVTSTTYRGGIEFDINEDSMLYAQIATGFKQGGMNMTAPPMEYKPEELDAWEFGSKNRFLDGRMQLNLEGYYYTYDNMQAQFPTETNIASTGATQGIQAIFNAETGTNKGIDVEFDYLITENDKIDMGLALMDATYGKLTLPSNPDFGGTEPFPLEGRQVAMSPDFALTCGYERTWRLDNGAMVTGRIDTKVSDGYPTTGEQYLAGAWQEGYTKSNFYVNYSTADGMWTAGVWAKNLENDAQTIFIVPFYRRFVTDPRTFGINVSFRY